MPGWTIHALLSPTSHHLSLSLDRHNDGTLTARADDPEHAASHDREQRDDSREEAPLPRIPIARGAVEHGPKILDRRHLDLPDSVVVHICVKKRLHQVVGMRRIIVIVPR